MTRIELAIALSILGAVICSAGLAVLITLACVGATKAQRAAGIDHAADAMEEASQ